MSDDLTFGECEGLCGGMVERTGWDRYCFSCQDEMDEEQKERWEEMDDEDAFLYTISAPKGLHVQKPPLSSEEA